MTNLENCPFCGGRDIKIYGSLGIGHHAACISCGLQAPTETGVTADQATAYWNTRAASRPAQEPVAWRDALEHVTELLVDSWEEYLVGDAETETAVIEARRLLSISGENEK